MIAVIERDARSLPYSSYVKNEVGLTYIRQSYMVVPKKRGSQYRPQNTIVLMMGIPKTVPLILGNPHMDPWEVYGFGFSGFGQRDASNRKFFLTFLFYIMSEVPN